MEHKALQQELLSFISSVVWLQFLLKCLFAKSWLKNIWTLKKKSKTLKEKAHAMHALNVIVLLTHFPNGIFPK